MIVLLISFAWIAALAGLVYLLARRPKREAGSWERSPRLLAGKEVSFEEAIGEMLCAAPEAGSLKTATAEHVRDGAQQDLYVGP
jgi:hypothetical protein